MQSAKKDVSRLPEIVENYRDYVPPREFRKLVEDLLARVPAKYLAGLRTIVLTSSAALTRDQRRQKVLRRNTRYRLAVARGAYYKATRSRPATIWLFVDNIVKSDPVWSMRFRFLHYNSLGEVLFHEIGHHIHEVHEPVYEGKENVADHWSRKLYSSFFRKHYWYLVPLAYPAVFANKLMKRFRVVEGVLGDQAALKGNRPKRADKL